jgi:hypothetical protein
MAAIADGGPIPALAVIDSRNVRGMAGRVSGIKRLPGVVGVITALGPYGFEVTAVAVGIALPRPGTRVSARMQAAAQENLAYAALVRADPRGRVLSGQLVERGGTMEEKITDVACATEVCRQASLIKAGAAAERAIVVVSEDIDISPAFRYAEELGVPVYAAAHDTVHSRSGSWLLLGETALVKMCGRPQGMTQVGTALRADIAQRVAAHATTPGGTWTAQYASHARELLIVRDDQGVTAAIDLAIADATSPGQRVNVPLTAVGVTFGGPRSSEFPQLMLAPGRAQPAGRCETATVEARRDPTRVAVRITSGPSPGCAREIRAAIASPAVGDEVLVHVEGSAHSGRDRVRLVGTLTPAPALTPGPADQPGLYQVIGSTRTDDAVARDEAGVKAILKLPRGVSPVPGQRFAGVIIDQVRKPSGSGPRIIAQAISTRLP